MTHLRLVLHAWLVCVPLLLLGCENDSGSEGATGGPTLVESAPIEGIVLRVEDRAARPVVFLLDPHTNKVSAVGWRSDFWDISPDGTHLLLAEEASMHLMRFARDTDSAPTLESVRAWQAVGFPRFAARGDRIYDGTSWADFAGERVACGGHVVSPDGRHHAAVCDGVTKIYDDFTLLATVADGPTVFTPDGQWLVLTPGETAFHIPSRTLVDDFRRVVLGAPKIADTPDWSIARWTEPALELQEGGGLRVVAPSGEYGSRIDIECDFSAGFAVCSEVPRQAFDAPAPLELFSPGESLTSGRDVARRLTHPKPADYQRSGWNEWSFIRATNDGDAVLFLLSGGETSLWSDKQNPWKLGLRQTVNVRQTIRRFDEGGKVVEATVEVSDAFPYIAGCPTGLDDSQELRTRFGREPAPMTELLPDTYACFNGLGWTQGVSDSTKNGVWGMRAGLPFADANGGRIASLDGRHLVGFGNGNVFPKLEGKGAICFTGLAAGGRRECLATGTLGEPAGIGGWATQPERATRGAAIVHLTPTAAAPGTEVHAFGWGFGTAGIIKVGDTTVPPADVISWSDTHVAFRTSAAMPKSGRVTVEGPEGFVLESKPFVLTKTALWNAEPLVEPSFDGPLREGLNVMSLGSLPPSRTSFTFSDGIPPPLMLPGPTPDRKLVALSWTPGTPNDVTFSVDGASRTLHDVPTEVLPDLERWPWNLLPALASPTPSQLRLMSGQLIALTASHLFHPPRPELDHGARWALIALIGNDGRPFDMHRVVTFGGLGETGWWSPFVGGLVRYDGCDVGQAAFTWGTCGPSSSDQRGTPEVILNGRPVREVPQSVGVYGDTWLYSSTWPVSPSLADGFLRSTTNGDQDWSERTTIAGTMLSIAETIAAGSRPGFWGFAQAYGGLEPKRLMHIAFDGAVDTDAGPMPSVGLDELLDWEAFGTRIVAHRPETAFAEVIDTDAPELSWQRITSADLDGRLTAFYVDHVGRRFIAARDDFTLHVASFDDPLSFTALASQPTRELVGQRARIVGLGVLPGGRLLVLPDRVGDADDEAGQPLMHAGLLGPVLP